MAYQRGLWHLEKATPDDSRAAEQFFRVAVDLDPNFAVGLGGLAYARIQSIVQFSSAPTFEEIRLVAEPVARRAVALDSNSATAHSYLSPALFYCGELDGALSEAERAVALSPNLAMAHAKKGAALIEAGNPQEGPRDMRTSLRLDPLGSDLSIRQVQVAR